MQQYKHSRRRHIRYAIAVSATLLLVLSFLRAISITTTNTKVSLQDVMTLAVNVWNLRSTPLEHVVATEIDLMVDAIATEWQRQERPESSEASTTMTTTATATTSRTATHRVQQLRQLQTTAPPTVQIKGELRKWHKVTLAIQGPKTFENDLTNNPFTNYRLDVTFVHPLTGTTYKVPGYYATDGNAANTGAKEGSVWYVHFAPDHIGTWTYTIDFQSGIFIAIQANQVGVPVTPAHQMNGTINILATDKTGRDHRGKGRLEYVGKHHFQFQETKEYFLKAGSDRYATVLWSCFRVKNVTHSFQPFLLCVCVICLQSGKLFSLRRL